MASRYYSTSYDNAYAPTVYVLIAGVAFGLHNKSDENIVRMMSDVPNSRYRPATPSSLVKDPRIITYLDAQYVTNDQNIYTIKIKYSPDYDANDDVNYIDKLLAFNKSNNESKIILGYNNGSTSGYIKDKLSAMITSWHLDSMDLEYNTMNYTINAVSSCSARSSGILDGTEYVKFSEIRSYSASLALYQIWSGYKEVRELFPGGIYINGNHIDTLKDAYLMQSSIRNKEENNKSTSERFYGDLAYIDSDKSKLWEKVTFGLFTGLYLVTSLIVSAIDSRDYDTIENEIANNKSELKNMLPDRMYENGMYVSEAETSPLTHIVDIIRYMLPKSEESGATFVYSIDDDASNGCTLKIVEMAASPSSSTTGNTVDTIYINDSRSNVAHYDFTTELSYGIAFDYANFDKLKDYKKADDGTYSNANGKEITTAELSLQWLNSTRSLPIGLSVDLLGMIKSYKLMDKILVQVMMNGKNHYTSGVYMVMEEHDIITDDDGFKVQLKLIRIKGTITSDHIDSLISSIKSLV